MRKRPHIHSMTPLLPTLTLLNLTAETTLDFRQHMVMGYSRQTRDRLITLLKLKQGPLHARLMGFTHTPLTYEQSLFVWKTAYLLTLAISLHASQENAITWLHRTNPAMGAIPPIDHMATQEGQTLVETIMQQIAHGVYI